MIKYEESTEMVKRPTSVACDVCKKDYTFEKDFLETQEFRYIRITGGFGSVFGDGAEITCDICQHCLKELIGKYCRNKEEEDE